MTEMEAVALFKCLADKSRLQILKSLAIEDMYVERLAERLGLTPSTTSFHLKKLMDAGAVKSYKNQYYTMYSLRGEVFQTKIIDVIREKTDETSLAAERDAAYRQKILRAFFEYDRLKSLPAQRKKKLVVLEEIVKAFEKNRVYTEREVNLIIADYFDDFCTIRRDMISEGLMERSSEGYWRTEKTDSPAEKA